MTRSKYFSTPIVQKIIRYWVPLILYAGLIVYFSSLSHPEARLSRFFLLFNDKVIHAIEYAILGILFYRTFDQAAGRTPAIHASFLAVLASIIFGLTDEIHQFFVPLRKSDGWDLLADSIGATIGVLAWRFLRSYSINLIGSKTT